MRKVWIIISLAVVFGLLCCATASQAQVSENATIEIIAKNQPLRELLESVERKSGIDIGVYGRVGEERITVKVFAPTWPQAIRKLLRDFNRVESWNDDGTLQKVVVLSRKEETPAIVVKRKPRAAAERKTQDAGDAIPPAPVREQEPFPEESNNAPPTEPPDVPPPPEPL